MVLWEGQIEKTDESLLLRYGGLSAFEPQTCEITQLLHLVVGDGTHFQVGLAQHQGDEEGVDAVGLGTPDGDIASGGDDERVDDVDGVSSLSQGFEKHHPVVAGRLQADTDRIGWGGVRQLCQQLLEALATVGHFEVAEHRAAALIEDV